MDNLNRQKGASLVSWLVILFMAITIIAILFKLIPAYAEDSAINSAIEAVAEDPELTIQNISTYRKKLESRFVINSISTIASTEVKLVDEQGSAYLTVDYERRVHGFFNIDFICKFKHKVKVKIR